MIALGAALLWICVAAGQVDVEALQREVEALSADVELLAQLNRLQLSPEQLRRLAELAREVAQARQEHLARREQILSELSRLLRRKRALLLRDQPVPEQLDARIVELNVALRQLEAAQSRVATAASEKLRNLLSRAQWDILVRRQEARQYAGELLDWVRELDGAEFEQEARAAAEELADPERGMTADKILAILRRARQLSGADYDEQRPALIEELLPAYALSEQAELHLAADFLSNPRLLSLVEDKLSALQQQP